MTEMRPYQRDAGAAVEAAFFDHSMNRLLVKMPTGTGKTVLFAGLLRGFARLAGWFATSATRPKMLVIAHREELLEQARDKIEQQNPGMMVSIEQGDRYANVHSDVIVASIQTLTARKFTRLRRLLQRCGHFSIVIVDEAHHAAAASYRTALAHLGFLPLAVSSESGELEAPTHDDVEKMKATLAGWDARAPKDRLLIGVTATPNRSDAIGLECVFQSIAYSYGLKQAIEDGWLVPPVPFVVETTTSLDAVRTTAGDFNQKDLAEAVNSTKRNALAVAAWKEHANGLPTLAFTVDVQHAHDLAAVFSAQGISARALSGQTPRDERRKILSDYSAGFVEVITNCMVLTEGTDLPLTSCILHAKPTKSATLYEQMTGRGLRLFEDKHRCTVIDLVDVARRHSLQTAPVLYGLPPGIKADGKELREVQDALEAIKAKYPSFNLEEALAHGAMTLAQLEATASTFDIWTVPELGALRKIVTMNWIKSGEDVYRLQYPWSDGVEILKVERDLLGHFDISLTLRPKDPAAQARQRTLAAQVQSVEAALQLAETFVNQERRSAARITDNAAPWRHAPASEKQMQLLRGMKVPFNPRGLTKGSASDLINLAKARRGR
jgi:superfamily II DNA or RNA helicase